MAYALHVKRASKETHIADNTPFLEVEVEVKDGKKAVETRKFGYPLGTSAEDVDLDLSKFLLTYTGEQEAAVEDKKRQEEEDAAQETITSISGLEIDHDHATAKATRKAGKKG